jgi:SAM-dependent methyltransferase
MPEDPELLERMRSDWNQRAKEDAYFYVAFVRRNQSTEEFESSASVVIHQLEAELARLPPGDPSSRRALEVGCGPGRLMIPLSRHFAEIHGVDVSDEMIRIAEERLSGAPNARVHVNNGADLAMFEDGYFDFVYSCVVFQHIPSRQIVLNYLCEIHRVLKTCGVLQCQFRGSASDALGREPNTWSGCSFTGREISGFAGSHGFQLLTMSGEGTPYMLVTLRKADHLAAADVSQTRLLAVTAPDGSGWVPQRGRGAGVSLWIGGLPDACDLNDLTVNFSGVDARGCYLSPIAPGGGCQLNALLPKEIVPGPVLVQLGYRGSPIGEGQIEVTSGPERAPRVAVVTDGINLQAKARVESGTFKVALEDIENPADVSFRIGSRTIPIEDVECLDRIGEQFYYTLRLPPGILGGKHFMAVRVSGLDLPAIELDVRI